MNKRAYIQANKDWLEAKSKEDGVKALPKGIYYKVLSEGSQSSATPTVRSIITPASYTSFKDIKTRILDVAQKELFELYGCYHSNLWFDYQEGAKKGRGGKVSSIYVYIYT